LGEQLSYERKEERGYGEIPEDTLEQLLDGRLQ
jgi:hypothetical protein